MDAPAEAGRAHQRSAKNYLLRPMIQVRLGIYSILLGVLFAGGTLGVLYAALTRIYHQLLTFIVEKEEAGRIVEQQFRDAAIYLVALAVVFVIGTVVVSVLYTHRLVGPTFAFRRHIRSLREGRYEVRTALRRHDAFKEVADDLNDLSEHLQQQQRSAGGPA